MGYRSQVLILIKGERQAILTQLAAHRLVTPGAAEWIKEYDRIKDGDDLVLRYHGCDVKWYESYEDVQGIKDVYDYFQELEDFTGRFVRIGEEANDIEEHGFGDDDYELAGVQTSIESGYLGMDAEPKVELASS